MKLTTEVPGYYWHHRPTKIKGFTTWKPEDFMEAQKIEGSKKESPSENMSVWNALLLTSKWDQQNADFEYWVLA